MDSRRIVLAQRPRGVVDASTTRLETVEVAEPRDGEALIQVGTLSIDPTIRTWMNDAVGYLPPIGIGETIRGAGTGRVVASRSDRYHEGDVVFGMTGWQEFVLATPENSFTPIPTGLGLDLATVMNVLGVTGITAYFGVIEIGGLREGDVVVVSGAGGATGSVAGQVARARGAARVVGIAGGPDKCRAVVERYGFDACVDYKAPDLAGQLRAACPNGVDLYFDNVGGEVLNQVLALINMHARVVLCGAISQYNDVTPTTGLTNHTMLIVRRGRMEGFIVLDFADRFPEAQMALATMVLSGELTHDEHLVAGLENAPDALNLLFSGGNRGKTLVVVDGSIALD